MENIRVIKGMVDLDSFDEYGAWITFSECHHEAVVNFVNDGEYAVRHVRHDAAVVNFWNADELEVVIGDEEWIAKDVLDRFEPMQSIALDREAVGALADALNRWLSSLPPVETPQQEIKF
jgi:hypothetical protein